MLILLISFLAIYFAYHVEINTFEKSQKFYRHAFDNFVYLSIDYFRNCKEF